MTNEIPSLFTARRTTHSSALRSDQGPYNTRLFTAIIVNLIVICTPAFAAPAPLPAVAAMHAERLMLLENQIASWSLQRAALAVDQRRWNDLRIDLLVLERWYLIGSQQAVPESPEQIACWLRSAEISDAREVIETWIAGKPTLTPKQNEAMRQINKLTYTLATGKDASALDKISAEAGGLLLALAAPEAGVRDSHRMRPKAPEAVGSTPTHTARLEAPSDELQDISLQIRKLNMSETLRRQLFDIEERVKRSAAEKGQADEAKLLNRALVQATQIVRGLSSARVMSESEQKDLEESLAEGLALFADVRTRSAGEARLAPLEKKAGALARIARLPITTEMFQELESVLTLAIEDDKEGAAILATIERFLELSQQFRATTSDFKSTGAYQQALERLAEAFAKSEGDFMSDAASMGGLGGNGLEAWSAHLSEMSRLMAIREKIDQLSQNASALTNLKTRPTGAAEKRITQTLNAVLSNKHSPQRESAMRDLNAVASLAFAAGTSAKDGAPIAPEIVASYASDRLDAFDARRKTIAGELANQWAAGTALDAGKLHMLEQSSDMRNALAGAGAVESAVKQTEILSRWIDFHVKPEQLARRLEPYRENLAAAFEGFARGDAEAIERWDRSRGRYQALVDFLTRVATAYGEECAAMPAGDEAALLQLLAPLDRQPFADMRYASFALAVWARCEDKSDFANADLTAQALARHLTGGTSSEP